MNALLLLIAVWGFVLVCMAHVVGGLLDWTHRARWGAALAGFALVVAFVFTIGQLVARGA